MLRNYIELVSVRAALKPKNQEMIFSASNRRKRMEMARINRELRSYNTKFNNLNKGA